MEAARPPSRIALLSTPAVMGVAARCSAPSSLPPDAAPCVRVVGVKGGLCEILRQEETRGNVPHAHISLSLVKRLWRAWRLPRVMEVERKNEKEEDEEEERPEVDAAGVRRP